MLYGPDAVNRIGNSLRPGIQSFRGGRRGAAYTTGLQLRLSQADYSDPPGQRGGHLDNK